MINALSIKNQNSLQILMNNTAFKPHWSCEPYPKNTLLGTRNLRYVENLNSLIICHTGISRVHILNCISGNFTWFDHHASTVRDLKYNGNEIITSSWDTSVRKTDLTTLRQCMVFTEKSMGRCPHSSISEDGHYLISSSYDSDKETTLSDNRLRIWELKSGNLIKSILLPGNHLFTNRNVAAKFFEGKIYAISDSGIFCIYNADFQLEFLYEFFVNIREFLIMKKEKKILLSSENGKLFVFDIFTKQITMASNAIGYNCIDLTFHPNHDNTIIGSFSSGIIKMWRWPDFKNPIIIETNIYIWKSIVIGNKLLTGGANGPICIFDISDLSEIKLFAKLNVYKDFYFLQQERSKNFYTNACSKIRVFDTQTMKYLDENSSSDLVGSNNSLNVLHEVFDTSTSDHTLTKVNNPLLHLLQKN